MTPAMLALVGGGLIAILSGQWNLHVVQRCWSCGGRRRVPMRPPATLLETVARAVAAGAARAVISDVAEGVVPDAVNDSIAARFGHHAGSLAKEAVVTTSTSATHFYCTRCGDLRPAAGCAFEIVNGSGCLLALVGAAVLVLGAVACS